MFFLKHKISYHNVIYILFDFFWIHIEFNSIITYAIFDFNIFLNDMIFIFKIF